MDYGIEALIERIYGNMNGLYQGNIKGTAASNPLPVSSYPLETHSREYLAALLKIDGTQQSTKQPHPHAPSTKPPPPSQKAIKQLQPFALPSPRRFPPPPPPYSTQTTITRIASHQFQLYKIAARSRYTKRAVWLLTLRSRTALRKPSLNRHW